MSNDLAIATVTAAMREMLYPAVSDAVAGADVVYTRPGIETMVTGGDGTPRPAAHLFLYGVTPNAAWRNTDLPTRRTDGTVARRPQAAVDLSYLIAFSGNDRQLEPQRMLSSVVRTLHTTPVLTRKLIEDAKVAAGDVLSESDLEEAAEPVRFTPLSLSLEELSKLWSVMFQTPYTLSVAYQGTVVLLDADRPSPRPSLPVSGRNVYVVELRRPEVASVSEAAGPRAPILPTGVLVLQGRGLAGEMTRVRLGSRGDEYEPTLVTPREVRLPLAVVPPDRLRAGIQGVQVVHPRLMGTPVRPHRGEESNVAPFVLRPVVRWQNDDPMMGVYDVTVTPANAVADTPARVTVRVTPVVGARQRVELLLNELAADGAPAFLYDAPVRTADSDTVTFDTPGLGPGRYLVRVRVDGAESVLESDPAVPDDPTLVRPSVLVP